MRWHISGFMIVCSTVCSGVDGKKHQSSSASLAFVSGIHRWPVNSPHKGQVTRKMFPFDDVIMGNECIKFLHLAVISPKKTPQLVLWRVRNGCLFSVQALTNILFQYCHVVWNVTLYRTAIFKSIEYIPWNMHTGLFCFVFLWYHYSCWWTLLLIYPNHFGLLQCYWGKHWNGSESWTLCKTF